MQKIVLLSLILFTQSCMNFRTNDSKTLRYFEKRNAPAAIHRIRVEGQEMRYVMTGEGQDALPLLVFVHGAPGSANAFHAYLADSTLQQHFRMVSIDRLGYGYSGLGRSVTNIFEQAQTLKPIIDRHGKGQPVYLVGHSYGGPIVARLAMEQPEGLAGVMLLAPAIDPDAELIFWFSYLGIVPPFRWAVSKAMQVAADEKFSHAAELRKMVAGWRNLQVPVVHIHGTKDRLVPFSNLGFSQRHIPKQLLQAVPLEKADHFIPWSHREVVREWVVKWVDD